MEGEADWDDEVERRRLQAALLHPTVRSEVERELAAMQMCTSQKTAAAEGTKKKIPEERAAKAARWRAELGLQTSKMREKLWPVIGTKSAKKAKKHLKKGFAGKVWSKMSAAKKDKKAAKKADASKPAAKPLPPAVSEEQNKLWAGVKVRVTSPTATVLWQNSTAVVQKMEQAAWHKWCSPARALSGRRSSSRTSTC